MKIVTNFEPNWNWGAAWNRVRDDLNTLAWLFEEERTIQRLYVESAFWVMTGTSMTVDEFSREVGFGTSNEVPTDEYERPAESALDAGSESQV